ncbi:hypothetical protein Y032_0342g3045 [Ancylostoma ceylanicum]|uniref:CRIB domain-containing protein n=2 Tax=Ancylostoma ceylanicum TaxID=53326 RepID=A0A016RXZ1_9BILA|nr:hypothetical protein Y032_0342g3045 [Ancylostoma ceylanicum]
MWMVVTEDAPGRVRFEYRDLNCASYRKLLPRPIITRPQRLSRGCPCFPSPALLPTYHSSPHTAKDYEYERYDNVTPEPQSLDDPFQLYFDETRFNSGPTPYSERQTSTVHRIPCKTNLPSTEHAFYYYSQSDDSQLLEDEGISSEDHHLVPVSCGEYVVSFVPGSSSGNHSGRLSDVGFETTVPRVPERRIRSSSTDCQERSRSLKWIQMQSEQSVSTNFDDTSTSTSGDICSGSQSGNSSDFSKVQSKNFRLSWRRKPSAAAKNPMASTVNAPFALSSTSIGSSLPTTHTPVSGGVTPVGTMVHAEKISATATTTSFFSRKDKKKKDKRPRIRKEDISNPTNFQHKAHVGWDQDNGFSNNMCDSEPMDESIKNIIRAAGQDPTSMSKKTIKFVYDFIENYKDDEHLPTSVQPHKAAAHITPQWSSPAPPPPPSRTASHQSSVPPARPPPPPPAVTSSRPFARPLPQVPSVDVGRPAGVPPPPPSAGISSAPPPPPPPPPPPSISAISSAPAAPPPPPSIATPNSGRGNLLAVCTLSGTIARCLAPYLLFVVLQEIQAGKQLRSVGDHGTPERANTKADARDNVMAQIRQGAQLKHVDTAAEQEKRRSETTVMEMGGIAGALAKALEERRMNMALDDSSEEEESDERNEWSD